MSGVELIAAERQRQVDVEDWTSEDDDLLRKGELAHAAVSYVEAAANRLPGRKVRFPFIRRHPGVQWPWNLTEWKPSPEPIRNLVKAGALIAAEIDRLQRKSLRP